jgi:hypothetical protein
MNDYTPTHGWGPELNEFLKDGRTAWSDAYNDSKHTDSFECCIVCGKRTTQDKGIAVVLGAGGQTLVHPTDADEAESNDNGFMGMWLVGPECGKAIPTEYRWQGVMA